MPDPKDGHIVRAYMDGTAIAKETDASIKFTKDGKEVTHKDTTSNWSDVIAGKKSCELSGNMLVAETESFEDLWTAWNDDTTVTMRLSDEVSANKAFEGDFLLMDLEVTATDNEHVTCSWSAKNKGQVERVTVT